MTREAPLSHLLRYPLMDAMFGRQARRFGLGMEIALGPLAFKSRHEPAPLSELERAVLVAAGTGVTGWSFGVPYGPDRPDDMRITRCAIPGGRRRRPADLGRRPC